MLSDLARDIKDLGGQILFEEIDNATKDPFEWGRGVGKITAGAEMAVAASAIGPAAKAKLANSNLLGKGSKLFGRGGQFGQKGIMNQGTVRTGWGWEGTRQSGHDVFRASWSKPGNRSYWNHLDWF